MPPDSATHPGHRSPAEIISHAVWLRRVFGLGLRGAEPILAGRGAAVAHEGIRQWGLELGAALARELRRRRPRPGDAWRVDGVFIRTRGKLRHLWRAVGQRGAVLDTLVQDRRDATAAKRFLKRPLAGLKFEPQRATTGGLRGRGAARREVLPEARRRTGRRPNDRAGNPHRPTRRRERQTRRFKPAGQARRFLSPRAMTHGRFRPRRRLTSAAQRRRAPDRAFRVRRRGTRVRTVA